MKLIDIEERLYQITGVKRSDANRKFIKDLFELAQKYLTSEKTCKTCSYKSTPYCGTCIRQDSYYKKDHWFPSPETVPLKGDDGLLRLKTQTVKIVYQTVKIFISFSELQSLTGDLYKSIEARKNSMLFLEDDPIHLRVELTSKGAKHFQSMNGFLIFEDISSDDN